MLPSEEVEDGQTDLSVFMRKEGDDMAAVYLEIDASQLSAQINRLKSVMKEETFERAMYGIFQRTGGHVKRILKTDLPHEYHIKAGEVAATVGNARVSFGGGGVGCVIPIKGPRRKIGTEFKASGGSHGWTVARRARSRQKYKINAKIVKAGSSVLPDTMASYGGQPPFRNLGSKLGQQAYTRAGASRFPIMKVMGIGIPQMPPNRSDGEVQGDILRYLETTIEHRFQAIIAG